MPPATTKGYSQEELAEAVRSGVISPANVLAILEKAAGLTDEELIALIASRPSEETAGIGFQLNTQERVEWVTRKYLDLDAFLYALKERYEQLRREVRLRKMRLVDRFWEPLGTWAKHRLPAGKKSVKLLTGTLQFRAVPEKFKIIKEKEAVAWAETNAPEALYEEVTLKADPVMLETYFKNTGECPPGCEWRPASEKFYIFKLRGKNVAVRALPAPAWLDAEPEEEEGDDEPDGDD